MNEPGTSPRIVRASWGRIEVDGPVGVVKDAKLYPGGGREWDWGETGTRHRPGILPGDVRELLENGAEVIVLSRGVLGRLGISPETEAELSRRGVPYHAVKTNEAVDLYNDLRESRPVGGLFHSTC